MSVVLLRLLTPAALPLLKYVDASYQINMSYISIKLNERHKPSVK